APAASASSRSPGRNASSSTRIRARSRKRAQGTVARRRPMTNEGAGPPATYGLILAGGLARRMGGGDKALIRVGDKTILERTIATLGAQCAGLLINANGDVSRFSRFGLPVVADDIAGFAGPLAGILAGLDWVAANAPKSDWVLSVPGDCPFLPRDLVARLHAARIASELPL